MTAGTGRIVWSGTLGRAGRCVVLKAEPHPPQGPDVVTFVTDGKGHRFRLHCVITLGAGPPSPENLGTWRVEPLEAGQVLDEGSVTWETPNDAPD